jgi:hypothetical protein
VASDQLNAAGLTEYDREPSHAIRLSRPPGASADMQQRHECPIRGTPIDVDTGRICRYCKTLLPPPEQQTGWTVVAISPAAHNA